GGGGRPLHSGSGRRVGPKRQGGGDRRRWDFRRRLRQGRIRRHHRRASGRVEEPSRTTGGKLAQRRALAAPGRRRPPLQRPDALDISNAAVANIELISLLVVLRDLGRSGEAQWRPPSKRTKKTT